MIGAYLTSLRAALGVPRRYAERIVAEAGDHLHEAAAALVRDGCSREDAEQQAVDRFGPAAHVAHGFAEETATALMRRAIGAVVAAGLITFGVFATLDFAEPAAPWTDMAPPGDVWALFTAANVLAQVAAVAGLVGVARVLAHRRRAMVDVAERRLVLRAAAVAGACLAAAVPFIAAQSIVQVQRSSDSSGSNAALVGLLTAMTVAVFAGGGLAVVRAWSFQRVSDTGPPVTDMEHGHVPSVLERHPWWWCAATALAVAAAFLVVNEHDFPLRAADAAVEATAVVLAFWLLGPALGLRRHRALLGRQEAARPG